MRTLRGDSRVLRESFERDGFLVVRGVVGADVIDAAVRATSDRSAAGEREPLETWAELRGIAHDPGIRGLCDGLGVTAPRIVRSIFFDKTPERNWPVAPHQDTTIAVRERREAPGFGPWSVKDGVDHVRPPARVLESIVTIRVHLDDAGEENGALRVIPGTHREGVLSEARVRELASSREWVTCAAAPGDVVVMSPLTIHASRRSASPGHRRVLHLEMSGLEAPDPLRWHRVRRP